MDDVTLENRLTKIEIAVVAIAGDTKEIKEQTLATNGKVGVLWADRSIWNWVQRFFIVITPIAVTVAVVVANYLTAK